MNISDCMNLEELFKIWKQAEKDEPVDNYKKFHKCIDPNNERKENFWIDGFIGGDYWIPPDGFNSKRILFIAKECHSNGSITTEDSTFFAHEEIKKERENNIKTKDRFLKGVAMLYNAYISGNYEKANKDIKQLENAAFMNLNKRGGYSCCNWDILVYYVEKYQKFIKKQIELINPKVIICCGPSVKYLLEEYNIVEKNDKRIKVAYHPSYFRISDLNKLHYFESNVKDTEYKPISSTLSESDSSNKKSRTYI